MLIAIFMEYEENQAKIFVMDIIVHAVWHDFWLAVRSIPGRK